MISAGLEYWYRKQFAIRAGYFHESETKGNRKYFATGIGLETECIFYRFFVSDFHLREKQSLANTMRFTLGLNFNEQADNPVMNIRVGFGYDVHQLAAGRKLILGGVEIPHEKGSVAHSDGDVLIHAICDALLGAANLRDIGYSFSGYFS